MKKAYIISNGKVISEAPFDLTKLATRMANPSQESSLASTTTKSPVGNKTLTVEDIAEEWIEFCRNTTL